MVKLDINTHNFSTVDSPHQNLSTDTYLVQFRGCLYFPIVFGNDIIMMPLLVTWFSNLPFLWTLEWTISLQSFNAVGCLWQMNWEKYNDDVIMTSYHEFECPMLLLFFCSFHSSFHYFSP